MAVTFIERTESKEPQDTKIIFADALAGIVDKAHAPLSGVLQSIHRIINNTTTICIKCVQGEIAPRGILGHIL